MASVAVEAALWGQSSPLGHPASGYRADLERMGVADAVAFYRERFSPKEMTLVVVGDVDAAVLKSRLDRGLGAWKMPSAKKPVRLRPRPAKPLSRLFLVDRPGAEQSELRLAVPGLRRGDRQQPVLEVLSNVLGGGFTSRLNQRLREQLGFTYGASSWPWYGREAGSFLLGTAVHTPTTADAVREILALVADLARREVPEAELTKAKQNLIRALPDRFESNRATASTFAELALQGLPIDHYEGYAAAIRKVTAREVQALARSLLPAGKRVIVVVGDLAAVWPAITRLGFGDRVLLDPDGLQLR